MSTKNNPAIPLLSLEDTRLFGSYAKPKNLGYFIRKAEMLARKRGQKLLVPTVLRRESVLSDKEMELIALIEVVAKNNKIDMNKYLF